MSSYLLVTPREIGSQVAERIKLLRIQKNWTQATMSERSGVSLGSYRRFEQTGEIAFSSLLLVAATLGRLADFSRLFEPPEAQSLAELERFQQKERKRGRL